MRKQRLRELEDNFVRRFWDISDRLSFEAHKGRSDDNEISRDDRDAALAYLRLCEDELDYRKLGWISNGTWRLWSQSMSTLLSRYPYMEVWDEVRTETDGPWSQEFELLRKSQTQLDPYGNGKFYDPCPRRKKMWSSR
jgi:hypothetical protein